MRKFKVICIVAILTVFLMPLTSLAANAPKVIMDGKTLSFDTPPFVENGYTFVPLRAIFEALGAQVYWNNTTKTVTAKNSSTEIVLTIGKSTAMVNGKSIKLDAPGKAVSSRTFVPLRFVSESMGMKVNWDGSTQTITINSSTSASAVNQSTSSPAITPEEAIKIVKNRFESIGVTIALDEYNLGSELSYDTDRFPDIIVDGVVYYCIAFDEYGGDWGGFSVYAVNSLTGDIFDVLELYDPKRYDPIRYELAENITDIEAFKKAVLGTP
jgi:hypothetical protein